MPLCMPSIHKLVPGKQVSGLWVTFNNWVSPPPHPMPYRILPGRFALLVPMLV